MKRSELDADEKADRVELEDSPDSANGGIQGDHGRKWARGDWRFERA
jgi:hypothetical protein